MAAADGTASELESMRRLFRVVSQRLYYTRPAIVDDALEVFGIADSPDAYFTPEIAAAAYRPGFEITNRVGAECFDDALILASLARTSGIPSRVTSAGSLGGFGHHQFTETFLPGLPHHGGTQTPTGGAPSDRDPWYVFDATDPFVGTWGDGFAWYQHGEAIAPRSMYGRATLQVRESSDWTPTWDVFTTDVDWTPSYGGWATLPAEGVLSVGAAHSAGAEHWLTASGATGYLGFSDKDLYRVSQEATGATSVRVRTLPTGGEALRPVLCLASATQPAPVLPEMCADPAESLALPPGESYVAVFNGEPNWSENRRLRGDTIQYELTLEYDGVACDEATAVDMGAPGTTVAIANDGCLKITQYPDWWGVRQMQLQNMTPGTYPVPFSWSNCGVTEGSDTITQDWQSFYIDGISDDCTTFVKLQGAGDGNVTIRYYAM